MELAQKEAIAIKEISIHLEEYCLNQIKASPYTLEAIHSLDCVKQNPSLKAVRETDVYRLRRGLCLPSAAGACINKVKRERAIGDSDGSLRVGDFFRLVLPFHGTKGIIDPETGRELPQGWLVATPEGDVYHQAIIAFSQALGVTGKAVRNFKSITEFSPIIEAGGAFAVSLDNSFVIERTLKSNSQLIAYSPEENPSPLILIEDEGSLDFREFEEGRHVVAVLEIDRERAIISDSFSLPQMKGSLLMELDTATIDRYLNYRDGSCSRGIIFSLDSKIDQLIKPEYLSPVVVPEEIVEAIKKSLR